LSLLFNSAVEYAIRKVQVNQDGLKLNGTHLLMVSADVKIMVGSIHTTKKNKEALVVASKEMGLEVNTDKTLYMVTFQDQNAGRSHNIKTDQSPFERVEGFKYLGITLTEKKFY